MTRIAYLDTSAREMTLADGTAHPTGYFAEEALKPYERFAAAGFDVTVITPDGNPPYADPYGLSWFFHYPDDDKDYLASVFWCRVSRMSSTSWANVRTTEAR